MMRVLGARILVALPPKEDEIVSEAGLVLPRDPDKYKTPSRGLVVQLGEKSNTVDLDDVRAEVNEFFIAHEEANRGSTAMHRDTTQDNLDRLLMQMQPAPFDVALGDVVLFPHSAGDAFEHDGVEYVLLHEGEILGVIERKAAA